MSFLPSHACGWIKGALRGHDVSTCCGAIPSLDDAILCRKHLEPFADAILCRVGTKRDRYGGRDLYGNVVGVDKENGLVILDMGGEARVKMKLSDIRKTLPTSLSAIRTEARLKKEPLTEEGDAKMEGFDLLEVLEEMHRGGFELHPLLQEATPVQCSSAWDVYNRPVVKDTGATATEEQRVTIRRNR